MPTTLVETSTVVVHEPTKSLQSRLSFVTTALACTSPSNGWPSPPTVLSRSVWNVFSASPVSGVTRNSAPNSGPPCGSSSTGAKLTTRLGLAVLTRRTLGAAPSS